MQATSPEEKLVKINYHFYHVSFKEWFLIMASSFLGLVIIAVLIFSFTKHANVSLFIAVPIIAIIAVLWLLFDKEARIRRAKKKEVKEIMAHGTKVIGKIISLDETSLSGKDESTKNFTYTVEYENPHDEAKTLTIKTPTIISDEMLVKEKDLPINVLVYVYGKKVHVDSLINPPYAALIWRKIVKYSMPILFVVLTCIMVFIQSTSLDENIQSLIAALNFVSFFVMLLSWERC